jgi:hypothetical protein
VPLSIQQSSDLKPRKSIDALRSPPFSLKKKLRPLRKRQSGESGTYRCECGLTLRSSPTATEKPSSLCLTLVDFCKSIATTFFGNQTPVIQKYDMAGLAERFIFGNVGRTIMTFRLRQWCESIGGVVRGVFYR